MAVSVVACLVIAATLAWLMRNWSPATWLLVAIGLGMIGIVVAVVWRWWRLPVERRFRFSMRGMLVGIAVFALWLGVIGVDLLRWGQEVATVMELFDRGVVVNDMDGRFDPLEPLKNVRSIEIGMDSGLPGLLGYVKDLPDLEAVNFRNGGVSDAGLNRVSELDRFPNLRSIAMDRCNVTDSGLERLANLRVLEGLYIYNCTKITGAGMANLAGLQQFRHLYLTGVPIRDAGMVHVAGLRQLSRLTLAGIPISDAGLAQLRDMPNLRRIDVHRTQVTEKGVNALCEALPDCFVTWDEASCPAISQIRQIEVWSRGAPQRQIAVITEVERIESIRKWIDQATLVPDGWQRASDDGLPGNSLSVRFVGRRRRLCEIGLGNGMFLSIWGRYRTLALKQASLEGPFLGSGKNV